MATWTLIQISDEQCKKEAGCLGYIGDEVLPCYVGIISQTIARISN